MKSSAKASREFQVFAKPTGFLCNLDCKYCYYLEKENLYPRGESPRMPDDILEEYIAQHIEAFPGSVISFSWHGGEPTLLGLDYFRKIVALERKHQPAGKRIVNGIQTNGTLIDDDWCRFLAEESFGVGLSLDGPQEMHDLYRVTKGDKPTHEKAMRGYELLLRYRVPCDILCVVHADNVRYPLPVYRFFRKIKAQYIGFLPLVETESGGGVSQRTVPAESWGDFLSTIYDEWMRRDVGRIKVQMFEEVARTALGRDKALCIYRETCGEIPVIEHNGDFYSCDHFVDEEHRLGNIKETTLVELLENPVQRAFGQAKADELPRLCRECEVLAFCHGGCPKDRFHETPDGEVGLNYLCSGYKRFFTHCRPFVSKMADLWRRQPIEGLIPQVRRSGSQTGRNDPCPCGSGRKYKKCCS